MFGVSQSVCLRGRKDARANKAMRWLAAVEMEMGWVTRGAGVAGMIWCLVRRLGAGHEDDCDHAWRVGHAAGPSMCPGMTSRGAKARVRVGVVRALSFGTGFRGGSSSCCVSGCVYVLAGRAVGFMSAVRHFVYRCGWVQEGRCWVSRGSGAGILRGCDMTMGEPCGGGSS